MLEYCGHYSAASGDLELSLEGSRLKVQPRPKGGFPTQETPPGPTPLPFRVGFVGSDRIAMVDPPMTEAQGESFVARMAPWRDCAGPVEFTHVSVSLLNGETFEPAATPKRKNPATPQGRSLVTRTLGGRLTVLFTR